MKRRIAALVLAALMLMASAQAEALMAELRNMRKTAGDRILEMETAPTPTPEPGPTPAPSPTPDVHYDTLAAGMKGDEVAELQQRLIDLGYLNGKADGSFGGKTEAAVKVFQQSQGLEPTGEADDQTQKALYWTEAPVQISYEKLNYRAVLEAPQDYEGARVQLEGSVLQVLESDADDARGVYTALRVATKGSFDDVVYVALFRPRNAEPIAEGDSVSVKGVVHGLYRYTTEAGDEIALPRIDADGVE